MTTGSEALFGIFPGLPIPPPYVPSVRVTRTVRKPLTRQTRKHAWVTRPIEQGPRGRPRKYPPALVGDVYGLWRVVALILPDSAGNERARVTCPNGHERDTRVFNLRGKAQRCPGCPRVPVAR